MSFETPFSLVQLNILSSSKLFLTLSATTYPNLRSIGAVQIQKFRYDEWLFIIFLSTCQTCCELRNSIFSCSDQHTFFIEVVPHHLFHNISKIQNKLTVEYFQIFETPQQLWSLQKSDRHVWSFNTLTSVAQIEKFPSWKLFICSRTIRCPKFSSTGISFALSWWRVCEAFMCFGVEIWYCRWSFGVEAW